MMTSFRPARRNPRLPVSVLVSELESRTLLSAAAIYPQPAISSVAPSAATPSNFEGDWDFTVVGATNFVGLHLNQTGGVVSGTYDFDSDGTVYSLPINGLVKGKKMTLEATGDFNFVMKVKLQTENSFKGKIKIANNPKTSAQGSRVFES